MEDRTPRAIASAFSRAIRAGDLAPGDRLPTVRDVAAELGVSPATVSTAWQALRRAGLVTARGRAGTFVTEGDRGWLSPRVQGMVGEGASTPGRWRHDLSRGIPDPALLPSLGPALRRVATRTASAASPAYQDAPVLPELREVLAASWPWQPEAITVVDGATDGIVRVAEHLVGLGDRIVLESPGFPPFLDLAEVLGAEVVSVSSDADGVRLDSLARALRTDPALVVLQPRAQNPTGVSTSRSRAQRLAALLRRHPQVVVVEDDHSGFISGGPDVSLGRWLPDQVVHVRSYSKSHGPDLRVAALGGPAALVDAVVARRMIGPGWTSRMTQTILLDLLTSARSVEEVAEARRQYFGRSRAVVAALARHGLDVEVPDGLNLWLPVRDERAALLHLEAAGVRVAAGSPFVAPDDQQAPHVRVTLALVRPEEADEVAALLAEATRA
ncbi:MAG: GntR family transcriptional regulator [Nocardioides sp.]|nr:GntR family transcriptional regulator [Nocardioides sp.]